ncbi:MULTISPECIES: hypothetical protein [unclassified Curtobacterium]|uniref:hypothetical protein n=1 Tax=unclassified Curtobacterium TaxID=257496 RepID=UPI001E4FF7F9|nr:MULTISPECIES: hypothetical protein [unclassified Curtobacterium]MCY1692911.1 hypothetical protein [Curtobacterium sp. SL109]
MGTIGTSNDDVEHGVVRLPNVVWTVRPAPKYQLVLVAVRSRPVEGERDHRGVEALDDSSHR